MKYGHKNTIPERVESISLKPRLLLLAALRFFVFISLLLLPSCRSARPTPLPDSRETADAPAAAPQTVRVGVYQNSPKIFVDDNGKPQGLWIDLLEHIGRQENWRLDYLAGSWEENLARLSSGEIDLLPDVAFSEERDRLYDFSSNVLYNWALFFTRPGLEVNSIVDLQDRKIAVLKGDFSYRKLIDVLAEFSVTVKFVEAESFEDVFKLLQAGQADAGVTNRPFGQAHEKEYHVHRSSIICCPAELRFAVKKETNADLLRTLNNHIGRIRTDKDSYYYRTLDKWLGFLKEGIPTWLLISFPLAILLALAFLGFAALLRSQVKSRTLELSRSNRELLELDLLKNNFVANVSHELRTPLVAIKGYTDLLKRRDPPADQRAEWLERIGISCSRLERTIERLLNLSNLQLGSQPFQMLPFAIGSVIESSLEMLQPKIIGKRLQVELELAEPLPLVLGDEKSISAVLLNLLDNAISFSQEQGRIVVSASASNGRVLEIGIRDNGIGIARKYHKRIFERFFQIDPSSTRQYEGLGIGLALAKEIIEFHNGRLRVESAEGQGSTFSFTLPTSGSTGTENAGARLDPPTSPPRPALLRGSQAEKR